MSSVLARRHGRIGWITLLARAPGETGTHLALTATRIGAHDAVACGLADHVIATSRISAVIDAQLLTAQRGIIGKREHLRLLR
jgi:enoyl-CoA hydratase/carnithine racemase